MIFFIYIANAYSKNLTEMSYLSYSCLLEPGNALMLKYFFRAKNEHPNTYPLKINFSEAKQFSSQSTSGYVPSMSLCQKNEREIRGKHEMFTT